jgi:hypothetical protein
VKVLFFFGGRIYACHNKASRGKEMGEISALNTPRNIKGVQEQSETWQKQLHMADFAATRNNKNLSVEQKKS